MSSPSNLTEGENVRRNKKKKRQAREVFSGIKGMVERAQRLEHTSSAFVKSCGAEEFFPQDIPSDH